MPQDISANDWMQGVQLGASIHQAGLRRRERMMELKANAAKQALDERLESKRIELLNLQINEAAEKNRIAKIHDAEATAASEAIQLKIGGISTVDPVTGQEITMDVPNPRTGNPYTFEEALEEHIVPLAMNGNPKAVQAIEGWSKIKSYKDAQEGGLLLRQAALDTREAIAAEGNATRLAIAEGNALSREGIASRNAVSREKIASDNAAAKTIHGVTPGSIQKHYQFYDSEVASGNLTPEKAQLMKDIVSGVKPRASAASEASANFYDTAEFRSLETQRTNKERELDKLAGQTGKRAEAARKDLIKGRDEIDAKIQKIRERGARSLPEEKSNPGDSEDIKAYRERIKAQFNSGAITREKAIQLLRDTGLK